MDVAEFLAGNWNSRAKGDEDEARAVDLWPVCRILADEGLLAASEEQVAAIKVGPFRFAQTRYESATRDFIEVLIPATMAGMADGKPLHAAVAGVLTAAGNTFLQLLRRGVSFGRTPADRSRWLVLLEVKEQNQVGQYPNREQVANRMPSLTRDEVESALDWLMGANATPISGSNRLPLVQTREAGGLEALV